MQHQHPDTRQSRSQMAVRRSSRGHLIARSAVPLLCLVAVVGLARATTTLQGAQEVVQNPTAASGPTPVATRQAQLAGATANPTAIRAGTAAGTCLAFGPLKGNRNKTIFIDPGHGGVDSGTSGTTSDGTEVYEKNLTLATGLDLLALLRNDGYRVVISRIDDRSLIQGGAAEVSSGSLTLVGEHDDIEARINCANAAQAAALVSIHFNAFSDPSINGTETMYDSARSFSGASHRLATLTQQSVLAELRAQDWAVPDRGVIDDTNAGTPTFTDEAAAYGHLLELGPAEAGWLTRPSSMPGILIEPLFLSHVAEADVAASIQGQSAIARGIAQALTTFFTTTG